MQNPHGILFGPEGNDPYSRVVSTPTMSKESNLNHITTSYLHTDKEQTTEQTTEKVHDDGCSISSKGFCNLLKKYRNRQKSKLYRIKRAHYAKKHVNIVNKDVNSSKKPKPLTRKEFLEQYKYRELLRKIKAGLEGQNVIPKVPYEMCDVQSPPVGMTICEDELIVPPRSTIYVSLKPIDSAEHVGSLMSMEGLGSHTLQSVGDALVVRGVAETVQISNWNFDLPWKIKRGEKLGIAREISWQALPSLDNIFEKEEDYILNFVKQGDTVKCAKRVNTVKLKPNKDLSPSELSELNFEKKCKELESVSMRLVETLRKVKKMFIVEDPGQKFEFMNVPPVSLKVKDSIPDSISPTYAKTFTSAEKQAIDQYIKMGMSSGMLERAPDSAYASPLLIIKKRSDPLNPNSPIKYRVLVDSRNVNSKCLKETVFAAPNVDDATRELGKCKYFSVFDIRSAFHRLMLEKKCRDLTAFLYHGSGELCGVYRYTCLAQGNSNSPHLFVDSLRAALGPVLKDLTIKIHIDDAIIGSETFEQHIDDVIKFLVSAYNANVSLDIVKCDLVKPEVDWCSQHFSQGTVRPSPDRLKCLDTLSYPDISLNKPGHKAYLRIYGLLNYYRKFIKDHSFIVAQTKDLVEAAWDESNETTFEEAQEKCDKHVRTMCECIRHAALTVVPEGTEILAYCDASSISISFSIVRASDRAPIMFGGRSLNKVERTYSSMDRELLSIRLVLEKASPFITTSKSCIIYNDNLSSILNFSGGAHNQLIARSLRLILQIKARAGPNVEFKHLKGIYNDVADALSRMAFEEDNVPTNPIGEDKRKVQLVDYSIDNESELLTKSSSGYFCAAVTTRSKENIRDRLRIIHEKSHSGYQKLYKTAKDQGIEGRGLERLCIEVCRECKCCNAEIRVLSEKILGLTETPEKEMRTLHIDHVYLPRTRRGNAFALTVLDIHSKYFCAIPVPTLTMDYVRIALQTYFTFVQTIDTVRADRAFVAHDIASLCESHDIKLEFFASHNSRSNAVERAHSTMRSQIESFCKAKNLSEICWDDILHLCVKSMNNTVHHTTGYTPYQCVFNKKPFFPGIGSVEAEEIIKRRQEIVDRINASKQKYVNKNVIPRLAPGTEVNIRYHSKAPRIPGVIVSDDGGMTAVVKKVGVRNAHATTRIAKRHLWITKKANQANWIETSLL